jgi:hypothetical protein
MSIEKNLKRMQYMLIAVIIAIAVIIPVSLKYLLPKMAGIDVNYVMTFLILLAGSLYSMYQPWIKKLRDYKQLSTVAAERGVAPPNAEEYFKHGLEFNKWLYLINGVSFVVSVFIAFYILATGSVMYDDWTVNLVINFNYAIGQAELIKKWVF